MMADQMSLALFRADLWRILSLVFGPPKGEVTRELPELANDMADYLKSHDDIVPNAESYRLALLEIASAAEKYTTETLEHDWNGLFHQSVLVPACEGAYHRTERGAIIGDVAGFYKAFEVEQTEFGGPPDSVWNEIAFVSFLSLKEGFAVENGMEEELSITRNALRTFFNDHLGRWAGSFVKKLLLVTDSPFYTQGANLLLVAVSLAVDEFGIEELSLLDVPESTQGVEEDEVDCPAANDAKITETS